MKEELYFLTVFLQKLEKHAERKAELYDGIRSEHTIDVALRLCAEELGEIASAITRDRFSLAREETLDLAHCAFLMFMALLKDSDKEDSANATPGG